MILTAPLAPNYAPEVFWPALVLEACLTTGLIVLAVLTARWFRRRSVRAQVLHDYGVELTASQLRLLLASKRFGVNRVPLPDGGELIVDAADTAARVRREHD